MDRHGNAAFRRACRLIGSLEMANADIKGYVTWNIFNKATADYRFWLM